MQEILTESNVVEYLRGRGLASPGEGGRVSAPGAGNINWVRRVRTADGRSMIVKQARPALERFPEYSAPTERIVFEARYYETTARFDRDGVRPRILHFDPEARVLVLEDLGHGEGLDQALSRGADLRLPLQILSRFLGAAHAGTRDTALARRFPNDAMRRLHGDHIFLLPYRENDFPLSPAVRRAAEAVWRDAELVDVIDASYARYLTPEGALVHADVQPGNLLRVDGRIVLIDAEIAHLGDPAFDLGTLLAHLLLSTLGGAALDVRTLAAVIWSSYRDAHGEGGPSFESAARYAGIEVLRRTLGAARVAAVGTDAASLAAVALGRRLTLNPPPGPSGLGARG